MYVLMETHIYNISIRSFYALRRDRDFSFSRISIRSIGTLPKNNNLLSSIGELLIIYCE